LSEELKTLTAKVDDVVCRLNQLEEQLAANGAGDQVCRWQYLIARPHR
jgi:hypothetical protein